jgi:hypothetical protein
VRVLREKGDVMYALSARLVTHASTPTGMLHGKLHVPGSIRGLVTVMTGVEGLGGRRNGESCATSGTFDEAFRLVRFHRERLMSKECKSLQGSAP